MVDLTKIKGLSEWSKARAKIESAVTPLLGDLSTSGLDLQIKVGEELEYPGYVRRRIHYFVDEWDRVSAWLFLPDGKDEKPAIVCCHRQTPQGKDEPAGIEGDPGLAFARHFAELGYATIAPDCVTAGDRVSGGLEPYDTSSVYKDHPELSALGKMLMDHRRSVDILSESRHVDESRIGVVGHGMGGYNALLLTAFDDRVQTCVSSCGFTCFAADDDPARWYRDSGLVLLPKLSPSRKKNGFPFDWDQVLGLMAPSPTLLITALNDDVWANTKSCGEAAERARRVYKFLGAERALEQLTHREGHRMSVEGLDAADAWFERWL